MLVEVISILIGVVGSLIATLSTAIIGKRVNVSNKNSEKIILELKQDNSNNDDNNNNKKSDENNKKQYDDKLESLIQSHHEQALIQSKIQFWFSLIAAVVGFAFIIAMVIFSQSSHWYEYIVNILPGGIIEAVSVLFFSQSRETRERASDFLNRLREDRQYEKAISIIESIDNDDLKAKLKAEISLHLCGIENINLFDK